MERNNNMTTKIDQIKTLLNGECESITEHTVSADWYRRNVDMYYAGTEAVDVVQCTYDYDLYAMPNYMTKQEYNSKTPEQIAEAWEI